MHAKESQTALAIVRDTKNSLIQLAGQAVSPQSSDKIYLDEETEGVYLDASGFPQNNTTIEVVSQNISNDTDDFLFVSKFV